MSDLIHLSNGKLEARIHPRGAELQFLRSLETGINYMWSGDPAWWGKYSPVLFPIVGTLKDNLYRYKGREYSLPRHGFARERTFITEFVSETAANFRLTDDSETRAVFPFPFQLDILYTLEGDRLSCRYTVSNIGEEPIWFSIGAHPAFAVPQEVPGVETGYEDYYLSFDHSSELSRYRLAGGLVSDEVEKLPLQQGRLALHPDLFREDAIVLKDIPDTAIALRCHKHPHGLYFHWSGFPFFGIWAAPGAPFVCLEPWCGIADNVHHDQEWTTKEGINSVPPGEYWCRQWAVSVF